MRNVITMAIKDLRLLFRDKFGLFWVLAFPLLMALLFGSIYSGGGGSTSAIKIAVADEDSTNGSRAYIEELSNSDALNVVEMSKEEAIEKVRKGKITAYIVLQKGFGATGGFSMFGGESPPMEVGMDPSRKAEAGYLQGILTQATFKRMQKRFMSPDSALSMVRDGLESVEESDDMIPEQQKNLLSYLKNTEDFLGAVDSSVYAGGGVSQMKEIDIKPVERENKDRPHSAFEITFPSAILWALIGCAAAFGISIVQERTRGTFLRLQLAPLSRLQILAGKGLACFITCMGVSALLLIIGNLGFNVRLENFAQLGMAMAASAICFVGIMMLISVMGKTEQAVSGAGWAILLVMSMIGGGMIPLMFMPSWLLIISHFSPVKWGIYALEGAIWRGFTVSEMLLPTGILFGVGISLFLIGSLILSRTDR